MARAALEATVKPVPIVVVSNRAEILGGGEFSLLGLLEALDRTRWRPVLVVPGEGEVAARAHDVPVAVVPLPTLRRPGPALARAVLAMRRVIVLTGAPIVHANGSRAMIYAGLAGRLSGRAVVWHVRIADRDPVLDRFLGVLASIIVVNSTAVARRFPRADHVRCVPNGVDLARFAPRRPDPRLRAALGLPDDARVAVTVGRFVTFKGHEVLLAAAARLRAARPELYWALVGDGETGERLRATARALGIADRVRFLGWREDVPDMLAVADVVVVPSLSEHFGRVVIEAMAAARPVIGTDAGGIPEIVTHDEHGLLVPPGSAEALASAVTALLDDPARAVRLAAAGRRRAEAHFSAAAHARRIEAVYDELLARRGGAPVVSAEAM